MTRIGVDLPGVDDPASGPSVSIVDVADQRKFLPFDNASPWTPSLDGRDESVEAPERVVGRQRDGYGRPRSNVYLEVGDTVTGLTREALTNAFRRAGYRVVAPGTGQALPLAAEVNRFWVWQRPGFWSISLEFEAHVRVQVDVDPFRSGDEACGYIKLHTQSAGGRAFRNTVVKGLDDFIENLRMRLATARDGPNPKVAFVDERCLEAKDQLPMPASP